jgi:hypothetical protein
LDRFSKNIEQQTFNLSRSTKLSSKFFLEAYSKIWLYKPEVVGSNPTLLIRVVSSLVEHRKNVLPVLSLRMGTATLLLLAEQSAKWPTTAKLQAG